MNDTSLFRPEFFKRAEKLQMKVSAGAQMIVRPSKGIGVTIASLAFLAATSSHAVNVRVAHGAGSTISTRPLLEIERIEATPRANVKSSLTRESLRAALTAKLGAKQLSERLSAASEALRKDLRDDGDSSRAKDTMSAWVAGEESQPG